jgi:hypothetical protein
MAHADQRQAEALERIAKALEKLIDHLMPNLEAQALAAAVVHGVETPARLPPEMAEELKRDADNEQIHRERRGRASRQS